MTSYLRFRSETDDQSLTSGYLPNTITKYLYTALLALLFLIPAKGWGQTTVLTEDFASITTGNNTSTSGSGTAWTGNSNFPTVANAYQAGGAVRLGSGSAKGSITSKSIDLSSDGGNVKVTFDVKGWATVEGDITVTITGQAAQTVTYTAVMTGSFETKSVTFTGGTVNSTVKIETTAKRAFIDNVKIETATTCTVPTPSWVYTPSDEGCPGVDRTYTTQAGMSNYIWTLQKTAGVDYTIISGGTSTDHTMTVRFLTKGGNRVTVGYTSGGCASTTPASWDHNVYGVSIGPLAEQNIISGINGNQLNASEEGTPVSREWKYTTTSGGSYQSFSTPITDTYYIPNFPTAGTYYVVCESTFSCGMVRSNEITINVTALQKPIISSANTKTNTYGTAANYQITASNSPTSYAVTLPATLPAGFTFNSSTGLLSSADNTDAGTYSFSLTATNSSGTSDPLTLTWTQNKRNVTISGVTVTPKVYDQTTTATLNVGAAVINTLLASDAGQVSISNTGYTANYNNKNAGTNKTVTITGLMLTGTRAGNYNLSSQPSATGNITKKDITVTGISAADKVYDGTTSVTFNTAGIIPNSIYGGDVVSYTFTGAFQTANVGDNKAVDITAVTLGGADGGNYQVNPLPTGVTANITKADPVFAPLTINLTVGGTQTITSTSNEGALSFTSADSGIATVSVIGEVTGVAVGTTKINVAQEASTNYNAGSKEITVNVNEIVYVSGDYRSASSGLWNPAVSQTASYAKWDKYNGSGWDLDVSPPATTTTTSKLYIENGHVIETGTSYGNAKIYVKSGGKFLSKHNSTAHTVYIYNSGTFEFSSNPLKITDLFEIEDGGTFIYDYNSNPGSNLTLWNGKEVFHPSSNFIVKSSKTGSNNYFFPASGNTTGSSLLSSNEFNGKTAHFGNLIFDADVKDIRFTTTNLNNTAVTHGNFEIKPGAGSGSQTLFYGNVNWTIGGNFVIGHNSDNLTSGANINLTTGGNTIVLNIKGNFINYSDNTLTFTSNTSASTTINLEGDMQIASIGKLISAASTNATLNFAGTWNGNKDDATIQTVDVANAATASNIAFNVNSGAYVRLINQNLALGTNSQFIVNNGGTLDFGFKSDGTALNIERVQSPTVSRDHKFKIENGGTLMITSPEGITSFGNYTGNVQIGASSIDNRKFDAGAIYHYIGKSNQATGGGLPDGLTAKVIVNLQTNATNENLEFTSTGITKFNSTGTLEIRRGKVLDIPGAGFRNNVIENEDGESDSQKGNILMTGGRYIVSGSGTKPSLSGTYTFTAGTVEFTGDAATKIRTSTPAKQYYNVDVSGTNVETGGKNFIVNNLLKITAATAKLTVPETSDNENPYVVTAKKGIQIAEGGQAIFKNNAQLMQDEDAVNSGNITAQRIAKLKFESIQTRADYNYWSSPVAGQKLLYNNTTPGTSFSPGTPNNRIFQYRESDDRFVATVDAQFVAGKGYAIRAENAQNGTAYSADGTPKTFEFKGTPNNGPVSTPNLNWSNASHGYNLIGNPYPSNIDFDLLWNANPDNIYSTAYFWTNNQYTQDQQGSTYSGNNYAIYNGTGGNPAAYQGASGSAVTPTASVKPGQGFIVQTKKSGALSFNNGMRIPDKGPFFNNKLPKNRFWLTLTSPAQVVNTVLIGYVPGASDDFEKDFDTPLLVEGSDAFYSVLAGQKLAIQGKSEAFENSGKVPLGTKHFADGLYTIALKEAEGIFEGGQDIYLYDKLNQSYTKLQDGEYHYSGTAGETANRFEIVYKPGTVLSTDEGIKDQLLMYRNGDDFVVSSKLAKIDEVEVYDVSGRLIRSVRGASSEVHINAAPFSSGTYVLKIKLKEKTVTKKIVK